MPVSVSDIRTVPVGEDLTTESLSLSVLRGMEKAHRVDHKSAAALALVAGEWGVLQTDGTVARPGASSVPNTFLCFCGTDRFDARATGQVTLMQGSALVCKTNKYLSTDVYVAGSYLTVDDQGSGKAELRLAASGDYVLAMVDEVGDGYLVYTIVPVPFQLP
jgi:hypothetical protein